MLEFDREVATAKGRLGIDVVHQLEVRVEERVATSLESCHTLQERCFVLHGQVWLVLLERPTSADVEQVLAKRRILHFSTNVTSETVKTRRCSHKYDG